MERVRDQGYSMCGLIGSFTPKTSRKFYQSFESALDSLHHRGPDSCGRLQIGLNTGDLELGFKRLSIIDLKSNANQPFQSSDGRYLLVFNGEIYNYIEIRRELVAKNYVFQTNSDTEVLINAWREWGADALTKFTGMFSFVVVDLQLEQIWCVRDAYGIKPFYYSISSEAFTFASETDALIRLNNRPPKLNKEVTLNYLVNQEYDQGVDTFFQDLFQLEPGHLLMLDLGEGLGSGVVKRWWWPRIEVDFDISFSEATYKFKELFFESVDLHLRSDVPIATALSGGLDSSAIVSAISMLRPRAEIHTFSYISEDPTTSEISWIKLMQKNFNLNPHFVHISSREFLVDLDDLIRTQGEPFGSTSLYAQYQVYRAAKTAGFTVMLDGQGADELLAGYHGFPQDRIHSILEKRDFQELLLFLKTWKTFPDRRLLQLFTSSISEMFHPNTRNVVKRASFFARYGNFFNPLFFDCPKRFSEIYPHDEWHGRRLSERLLKEQSGGQLVSLLRHADRNSMRWSVESRVPFLNVHLSQFLLSLPDHFLLTRTGETKGILRQSMASILPKQLVSRRDKIGFATPQASWLKEGLLEDGSIMETLSSIDFLNRDTISRFLRSKELHSKRDLDLKWRLLNLSKWYQMTGVSS